jgi:Secretion system C-terminal sorting domain
MKKQLLHISFICLLLLSSNQISTAQTAVVDLNFDGYAGTAQTVPAGYYFSWHSTSSPSFYSSAGNFGAAAPSYKFGNDSVFIVTPKVTSADSLSFWSRGNGSPFSPLNELRIYHSADSVNWTLDYTLVPLSASATTTSLPLNQVTGYFKFEYFKAPAGGNLAMDDLKIYSTVVNGVNDVVKDDAISVFPTPTSGTLNIRLGNNQATIISVELYDILGNQVKNIGIDRKGRGQVTIDLTGKSRGFYFVKIQTTNQYITKRITLIN